MYEAFGSEFAAGLAEDLHFPHWPKVLDEDSKQVEDNESSSHATLAQSPKKSNDGWKDVAAGLLGGCAGLFVGHPFDTVKVHGFYRGLTFPLVTEGVRNAVFFGIYGNALRHLSSAEGHKSKPRLMEIFVIGGCAGAVQAVIGCPVELIKIKLQAQTGNTLGALRYKSPVHCLTSIYRTHGISGCYQGMMPTMLRDFPGFATYITSYEYLTDLMKVDDQHPSVPALLLAGGLAGMCSWIVNLPIDIIKTRIQEDDLSNRRYRGIVDCYRQCLNEGSWKILWRGLPIICVRAFIINAVTFAVYSSCLRSLHSKEHLNF